MKVIKCRPARHRGFIAALSWSLTLACALSFAAPFARAQGKKPITKQGLVKALKLNALSTKELVEQLEARGVDFRVSGNDEAELRGAGARPEIIEAARANYRAATATTTTTAANTANNTNNGTTDRPPANVPAGPPLSKNEIVTMLQSGVPAARVEQFVEARGVNFANTPTITREIMAAGGNRALVGAISEKAEVANNDDDKPAANTAANRGPDYGDLTDKATDAMQANDANGAIRLLQQAIQIDQSQPTAHALMGFAQLYGNRNIDAATGPMRAAIERNGSAVFRVYHDHNASGFTNHCVGSFFVSKTGVSFKADDGNHTFEANDTGIKEAKVNALMGVAYGAFHVKLKKESGDANYNFAPATQQRSESQLITSLIQGY